MVPVGVTVFERNCEIVQQHGARPASLSVVRIPFR